MERLRLRRDEMGPWLAAYIPGVAIGAAPAIIGVGPQVGEGMWTLGALCHMDLNLLVCIGAPPTTWIES